MPLLLLWAPILFLLLFHNNAFVSAICTSDYRPTGLTVFNDKLYFAAEGNDGAGVELWSFDGTTVSSRETCIYRGCQGSSPGHMVVFNNKLYFKAQDGPDRGLWSYDGVNSPSLEVSADYQPAYLAVFNNRLYFEGDSKLWSYDGVNPSSQIGDDFSWGPEYLTAFNDKLYFAAEGNDGAGVELWSYDGTNPPSLEADINPGSGRSFPAHLAVFDGKLYFSALGSEDDPGGLWSYDGNNPPSQVDFDGSFPTDMAVFNSKLYFSALSGFALWSYDGIHAPSKEADDIRGLFFTVFKDRLYFRGNIPGGDSELWSYDGSNPPARVTDAYSGADPSCLLSFSAQAACNVVGAITGTCTYFYGLLF